MAAGSTYNSVKTFDLRDKTLDLVCKNCGQTKREHISEREPGEYPCVPLPFAYFESREAECPESIR